MQTTLGRLYRVSREPRNDGLLWQRVRVMLNLVELVADDDEQRAAPCAWGHIVVGHACYCHNDAWKEGPRKCPIYRAHGDSDPSKWHRREWELVELPMFKGIVAGEVVTRNEMRPCMPDDDVGGCPRFETAPEQIAGQGEQGKAT